MAGEIYRSAFTSNDLIGAASVACTAGQFNKLGEYQVQAGELVGLGFGDQSGQENAVGRLYMLLQTSAPAAIPGTVRIQAYTPQNRPLEILAEFRTEAISQNATDRTKQMPLAFNNIFLSEDKKIFLEFNPDATATVAKANTTINMDITRGVV
jgi:hypothetical protein